MIGFASLAPRPPIESAKQRAGFDRDAPTALALRGLVHSLHIQDSRLTFAPKGGQDKLQSGQGLASSHQIKGATRRRALMTIETGDLASSIPWSASTRVQPWAEPEQVPSTPSTKHSKL